jgi:glucosamine--fructose-6-phosphate aminotransferase (isomerizing)
VASDTTVFQNYTKGYYDISDKEIVKLSLTDRVESTILKKVAEEKVKIELPPGISHYYTMEMLDQPACVQKALNYGARLMTNKAMVRLGGLEAKAESLQQIDHLVMAACGTSHYATVYAELLMKSLGCFDYIRCIKASEITEDDLRFKNPQSAGFLSVSQSGETMDLLIPFRLAEKMGLQRINVVNKVNSTLARENNCGVFLNCGRELSVASTKAYISQVVVLTLVSLWFSQNKSYNQTKRKRARFIHELRNLPQNMERCLQNCIEFSKSNAEHLKTARGIMFVGQGLAEAVAQEGCLKMKELTYLHCQCFSMSSVMNNLFNYALINPGTPVIFVVIDSSPEEKRLSLSTIRKLMAKQVNMHAIIITDCTDSETCALFSEFVGGD